MPAKKTLDHLLQRFAGATPEMLDRVLTPYRLRIVSFETTKTGARKSRTVFKASIPEDVWTSFEEGTTGKVVPKSYVEGTASWKEIVKGRILFSEGDHVEGELYFDSARLKAALSEVKVGDYLEIDAFGVSSKIESALCEAAFFLKAQHEGFKVTRMPENVAKHVGTQNYFDFRLERGKEVYRVELKSLWGTDTTKARLIHTVSRSGGGKNSAREDRQTWATSSCRFQDQDVFAVAMWLRTGCITDFAFALSVSDQASKSWGLPRVPKHPTHVTQNPEISDPPAGAWTPYLLDVCNRVDAWRKQVSKTKKN